jgi:glycosyltransferase involved in cell wall biosynthesis
MKIWVMAARFALSGVPLAQVRFAQELAALGHQVELIFGLINPSYKQPEVPGVSVRVMEKSRVTGMLLPITAHFKRNRPDIVFSAGDHLNSVVLMAAVLSRSKSKISCSSRVTPFDTYSKTWFSKRWVLKQVMRVLMPRADALTCVSKDMVNQYNIVFNAPRHVCVYNIVDAALSINQMYEAVDDDDWIFENDAPLIIAAGMLEPWKGFSDLINAIALVLKTKRAKLLILGDGPLRGSLQALIDQLDVGHSVRLAGYVDNPIKYFRKANVFVLSSLVEGMPNVLVEAMMCGCTPVSTNCPTGPSELLRDGKYGYLVPVGDCVAIAEGICRALETPIPEDLLKEAVKPFAAKEVISRHFALLGMDAK